jgi:hypothetical protein
LETWLESKLSVRAVGNKKTKFEVFKLAPVGIPASDYEFTLADLEEMTKQLEETLHALHKTKWVHLDIRSSNVVLYEPKGRRRRWFLIDSEYATKIGKKVPKKRYTENYFGELADGKHDFDQLSRMIHKLTQAVITNEQLKTLIVKLEGWSLPAKQVPETIFFFAFLFEFLNFSNTLKTPC